MINMNIFYGRFIVCFVFVFAFVYAADLIAKNKEVNQLSFDEAVLHCKSESGLRLIQARYDDPNGYDSPGMVCQSCCDVLFAEEYGPWNSCIQTCLDVNSQELVEY